MNDSSWGAPPPRAGFRGSPGQGSVPGGLAGGAFPHGTGSASAHESGGVSQTRPMPIVSDPGGHGSGHGRGRSGSGGPHGSGGAGGSASSSGAGGDRSDPYGQRPASESSDPGPAPMGGKKRAGRDLRAAIGVGVSLGAVILVSLFFYKPVFLGVIVVAVVVGLWELTSRLTERKEIRAPLVPLAVGGAAMVIAGYVRGPEGAWIAMALTSLAVLVWRMTESPHEYLRDVTAAVFATFYVPFLATFVALMLAAEDGPWRVLTFLLLTVVSDTGAYAVGWRFGTHKLAPSISPGKTREGLGGAIAFAMAAGALCMQFLIEDGSWWQGLLLGLVVAVSATLGDLGESMIKRDLGIKDMGTLLPGHGGIMDRLDSLLPTAPVVWLLFVIFVGNG
ncbi:phosphatidate cytidylyltransferase [Streptomyces sp. WMMB 714]|uniref:phosphatidate cytidylyltransferase n=1 Tax=Streptomyces sp. WMMB 714 TaxID=1286822 RepID=UPI000942B4CB|nr:phosphatidate cytidylyltransferase [Streptomyces sp. WMMB 714]